MYLICFQSFETVLTNVWYLQAPETAKKILKELEANLAKFKKAEGEEFRLLKTEQDPNMEAKTVSGKDSSTPAAPNLNAQSQVL